MRVSSWLLLVFALTPACAPPPPPAPDGTVTWSVDPLVLHRGDTARVVVAVHGSFAPAEVAWVPPEWLSLGTGADAPGFSADSSDDLYSSISVQVDAHATPGEYRLGVRTPVGTASIPFIVTGGGVVRSQADFKPRTLDDNWGVLPDGHVVALGAPITGQRVAGVQGVVSVEGSMALDTLGRVYSLAASGTGATGTLDVATPSDVVALSRDSSSFWPEAEAELRGPLLALHRDGRVSTLAADGGWLELPGPGDVVQVSSPFALRANGDVVRYLDGGLVAMENASDAVEVSGGLGWYVRDDARVIALRDAREPGGAVPDAETLLVDVADEARQLLTRHVFGRGPSGASYSYKAYALRDDGSVWDHGYGRTVTTGRNSSVVTRVTLPGARMMPSLVPLRHLAFSGTAVYGLTGEGQLLHVRDDVPTAIAVPRLRLPEETAFFWAEADPAAPSPPLVPGGSVTQRVLLHRTPDHAEPIHASLVSGPDGVTMADVDVDGSAEALTLVLRADALAPRPAGLVEVDLSAPSGLVQRVSFPVRIAAPLPRRVALGVETAYAVLADGGVLAWGFNALGTLGNGTQAVLQDPAAPAPVPGLSGIVEVAASEHALALDAQGQVFAWGQNRQGECGRAAPPLTLPSPTLVAGLPPVVSVGAAVGRSWALTATGELWEWGGQELPRRLPVPPVRALSANGEALIDGALLVLDWTPTAQPPHVSLSCTDGPTFPGALAAERMGPHAFAVLLPDGRVGTLTRDPASRFVSCSIPADFGTRWLGARTRVTADGSVVVSATPAQTQLQQFPPVPGLEHAAFDVQTGDLLLTTSDGRLLGVGPNVKGRLGVVPPGSSTPISTGVEGVARP